MIIIKLFNKVVDLLAVLAAIIIIFTTAIIAYTVFLRLVAIIPGMKFVDQYAIRWSWQFAEHSMFWFPFLAAPWLLRNHKHVTVDLVLNLLPVKVKKVLYVLHGFLGIALCAVMTYFCTSVTYNNYTRGIMEIQVIDLPKYLLFIVLPVAFAVLTLQFAQNLVISIKNLFRSTTAESPVSD